MKKRLCALALCLCLGLTGCASMLERSYGVSSVHVDKVSTAEDPSILRVENYRELVSAVLYLVSRGEEAGVIQLLDYPGDVEAGLTAACVEVATQDPLGAYCVDYIKHDTTRVVSYDQAKLSIHYRRTVEQVQSIVKVTGTSAIRTELREALGSFDPEVVLRVAYFAENEEYIAQLIRQAYYADPARAQGMPQVEIFLYPETGRERVVEILLTYSADSETLKAYSDAAAAAAEELAAPLRELKGREAALAAARALEEQSKYLPGGPSGSYAALVEGLANDEGLAVGYCALCGELGVSCEVVEGTLTLPGQPSDDGEEPPPAAEKRFWNGVQLPGEGLLYLDLSAEDPRLLTAAELVEEGYDWSGAPVPTPVMEPNEGETPAQEG